MNQTITALEKSKLFAIKIVGLYRHLTENKKEYILSKQLLRSGTSIGANLSELSYAISKRDFINKIYIALKEASETKYWLELLYRTDFISSDECSFVLNDCIEIIRMLTATAKTTMNKLNSGKVVAKTPITNH